MRKHYLFLILVLILILSPLNSSLATEDQDPILITQVESVRDRGHDFIDIYTNGQVEAKGYLEDDQLIIEFPNAKIAPKIEVLTRKSQRIKKILTKQIKPKTAQVIIKLKKEIEYEIVNVFGRNKSVVEIRFTCEMIWVASILCFVRLWINPFSWASPTILSKIRDILSFSFSLLL